MKAFFLDRDGIINEERGTYTYQLQDFIILPHVLEVLISLKDLGFKLIVITNQAGISRGLYTKAQMNACHDFLQIQSQNIIDDFYYAPLHPEISESLSRKPDSLMFERAIAKYNIAVSESYMIGDKERDLIPARKLGIVTIILGETVVSKYADYSVTDISKVMQAIEF
jgi:D-glycero-D-manno-heptose 1,7-bisphosphate phosphatase